MELPSADLTHPILLTHSAVASNTKLANQLAALSNAAFTRSKATKPEKWTLPSIRFSTSQAYLDMMGEKGIVAVILDQNRTTGEDADDVVDVEDRTEGGITESKKGGLVACTAAVPWAGGWDKEGAGSEMGWEMKAVCVDGDARYLRRGLAVRVLGALEERVVEMERGCRREEGSAARGDQSGDVAREGVVAFWILAAECLNGAYWRRRGYEEVRKRVHSGIWGCKTSFEMVVLKKEVAFSLD